MKDAVFNRAKAVRMLEPTHRPQSYASHFPICRAAEQAPVPAPPLPSPPRPRSTNAQRDRYAAGVLELAQLDPNCAVVGMQMVKLTGSPNYKIDESNRLLTFVEEHLPLGKDEWDRVATDYNLGRTRGWVERDLDSLRRKFKALYSLRKPTGTAETPPHVLKSKELKRSINEKANVVEMDDEADADADEDVPESDNELFAEPDFRFDPNEGLLPEQESGGDALVTRNDAVTAEQYRSEEHRAGGEMSAAASSDQAVRTSLPTEPAGEFTLQLGIEGLAAFASTPQPSSLSAPPLTCQLRSSSAKKQRKTNATRASGSEASTTSKAPAARGFRAGGRDEDEARRYSSLQSSSNRLGGTDLFAFRDTVGAKRVVDLDDREASFAKAKRIRAMKNNFGFEAETL